jgi:hypothetical protein
MKTRGSQAPPEEAEQASKVTKLLHRPRKSEPFGSGSATRLGKRGDSDFGLKMRAFLSAS